MSRWMWMPALLMGVGATFSAETGPNASQRSGALAMAQKIDALVEAGYKEHGLRGNPRTSDETFARRAYLDIAGRIPTFRELTDFLDSRVTDKRHELIDQLLDSEGYVSHFYNHWADLLRIKTRLANQVNGTPYAEWVKRAIRDNMPYDQFVQELLTAEGRVTENGAAGYYIRDTGMPLDNLSNTTRIFLGTRLECAQCHDHPFDKWSQREFYELAAYTYGVSTRQRPPGAAMIRRAATQADLTQREQNALIALIRAQSYVVSDTSRRLPLPHDYKYTDGRPGEIVAPHTIFGGPATPSKGQSLRQTFAEWLTSPQNPRFAPVIANRLWARAMGRGLIEPLDDWTDSTEPSNPALLSYLTQQVIEQGFDLKSVLRGIYYSQAYQRQAARHETESAQPYHFPGPVLRRMTAEQVWDSVMTLIVPDLDGRPGISLTRGRTALDSDLDLSTLRDGEVVAHVRHIIRATAGGNVRRAVMELADQQPPKYRGLPVFYVRASEWIAPAEPGSLIDQFGASDRELIDSAHVDPTVTQALEMLNGRITNSVLDSRSVLGRQVAAASGAREQAEALFLSILGRRPGSTELDVAVAEIKSGGRDGLENIAAALLNTREFIFVQ